jgi:hypothetical protein
MLVLRWRLFVISANLDLIQRIDGGMQMTLGQVQIDDRVFQFPMAQQQLDSTQIRAAFQQMGGEAVLAMSSET